MNLYSQETTYEWAHHTAQASETLLKEKKKKKKTLQIRLFKTKPNDKKSLWLFTADKVHVVS